MPTLGDTELRLLLTLVRNTYGWNRPHRRANLRYRYLIKATGRQSEAIAKAIKSLEAKGLVHRKVAPKSPGLRNPEHKSRKSEAP